MFLSLSKTFAKFGKFRLGLGIRVTKSNVIWTSFILFFIYMLQLCWYILVLCFWLMYAFYYGIYWCIKKLIVKLVKSKKTN